MRAVKLALGCAAILSFSACKGNAPAAPDASRVEAATTAPSASDVGTPATTPADAAATPSDDAGPAPADAAASAPAPDAAPAAEVPKDERGFPEDPYRAEQPAPGPRPELTPPVVESFTLPSGLEVRRVAQTLPTVFMSFDFDTGAADDPPDQLGLASVCLDLFTESTAAKDKVAFSEAQADHAVSIFSAAGVESSSLVVRALESELGPALDLFAELVTSPGMRQDDFERIIANRKADLKQARGAPRSIAGRVWGSLVWGPDHPYGRIQDEADLDHITLDACKAWVKRLGPSGATLWVGTRLEREKLVAALGDRLARWTGAAPKAPEIPAARTPTGAIYLVHVPGAVQSQVWVGHPGPRRDAPDFEPTSLMMKILAGGFSSRVNMNLREAKGYAYGGSGAYDYRRHGSALAIQSSVETSTTALALREMANEVKAMREAPPKPEELDRERDGALASLPARFATPTKTLAELERLAFFGLPLDWFAGHPARLAAVDAAAILAAAKAHLDSGDVVVMVVGDALAETKDKTGTVLDALKALADEKVFGGGGLVVIDADGKPTDPPKPAATPK
ncbi:MAG: pitrilysin family protein [Myxococcota bacterium]